jgi:hypothetical protein
VDLTEVGLLKGFFPPHQSEPTLDLELFFLGKIVKKEKKRVSSAWYAIPGHKPNYLPSPTCSFFSAPDCKLGLDY